jgi:hypothetical protein
MSFFLLSPPNGPKQLAKAAVSAPEVADLIRVAEDLRSNPAPLLDTVAEIAVDERRRQEVVRRSYWHPNGFAKVKLLEYPEYSLRLHVWPAGKDRRGDMNPHSHRWSFASWLILGHGVMETYFAETNAADPDGTGYERYRYRRQRWVPDLRQRKDVHLRAIEQVEQPPGSIYSCTTDVIHTVDPIGNDLLVTAVVQGSPEVKTASVYVRPGAVDEQRHLPITAEDLEFLLRNLDAESGSVLG